MKNAIITILGFEIHKVTWQQGIYGGDHYTFCNNYDGFIDDLKTRGYNDRFIILADEYGEEITADEFNDFMID
jgi:hypothetical protein